MKATLTVPFNPVLDWLRWDVEHNGIDDGNTLREVEPFTPMPMASQSRRPRLQTSHS